MSAWTSSVPTGAWWWCFWSCLWNNRLTSGSLCIASRVLLHLNLFIAAFKYLLQHLNICCVSGFSEVQESLLPWLVYGMNWMELNESSATHSRKESSHLHVCLSVEWIEILRDIAAVLLSLLVKWLAIYVSALLDECVSLVCHVILFFFHLCLFEDYQCVALSDLSCAVTITVTVTNHHQPLQDVFLFPPWKEMKMGTRYCSTVTLPMSNVCAQRWGEIGRAHVWTPVTV